LKQNGMPTKSGKLQFDKKCEYNDGIKVDISGLLRILKGHDVLRLPKGQRLASPLVQQQGVLW